MSEKKGKKKVAAFLTLGCKVNAYETDAMERLFRNSGYEIGDFNGPADIYIVNTCTVTNIADRKSRQMLHRARKHNPDAVVVAAGCYVQAAEEALLEDSAVDLVVGNNQKRHIVELTEQYLNNRTERTFLCDMNAEQEYEPLLIEDAGEKTRAYIKIQDGCNQFCSYCIIPYTRGRIRSRDPEEVCREVEGLARKGYQEIVLTGIHLSSYGKDKKEEGALRDLILRLSRVEGIRRIRLGSLEPGIITEDFIEALKDNPCFCPHFHLSLQSGSRGTLRRMNRHYSPEEFLERCGLIREAFPDAALTTDVIVGFPGETEEEFQETEAFLKRAAFAQMHIFKYSRRKGTKAAAMENQVPEEKKNERSARLLALDKRLRQEYVQRFVGKEELLLAEEEHSYGGIPYLTGHNERYVKIAVPAEAGLEGKLLRVKTEGILEEDVLKGEVIEIIS